jgi:hypothetical protein
MSITRENGADARGGRKDGRRRTGGTGTDHEEARVEGRWRGVGLNQPRFQCPPDKFMSAQNLVPDADGMQPTGDRKDAFADPVTVEKLIDLGR